MWIVKLALRRPYTFVVSISIPLSILSSLILLAVLGQTINMMTLGGLALAIGILVDEATVEVENMHRHLAMGKSIIPAVLDGAGEIAVPALVSPLAISIVFVPVFLLQGTARYLFQPLAMAVVFAMMASYALSRTLVPTMARYLLASEIDRARDESAGRSAGARGLGWRIHLGFLRGFDRFRTAYGQVLFEALARPRVVVIGFAAFCALSGLLATQVGTDFFPRVDGGQRRLHVRGPAGTRLETAEQLFARVEERIRQVLPVGASITFLVIQDQRDLAQAHAAAIAARAAYVKARTALRRASGTLLADYGITVVGTDIQHR